MKGERRDVAVEAAEVVVASYGDSDDDDVVVFELDLEVSDNVVVEGHQECFEERIHWHSSTCPGSLGR